MDKTIELENDDFEILEDEDEIIQNEENWKVIVADDDAEVHKVTNLVLRNFAFEGKGLNILNAYYEDQVKEMIRDNPDTAVVFLDVIMDQEDSGLNVVKYIRDELKNRSVRIILRTGQPGQTPEEQTIENYDINDYKEKTELTSKKMFTTLITALRAYHHITDLEHSKKGLEEVIISTAEIFKPHLTDAFYDILLKSIISIVLTGKISSQEKVSGLVAIYNDDGEYSILSAEGEFADQVGNSLFYVIDEKDEVHNRLKCEGSFFSKRSVAFRFKSEMNPEVIVYIKCMHDFSEMERDLLLVFYSNVSISFSNMDLSNEIESTQKEILYTLGGIAEARSRELGQHVLRVAEYSKIIALGYGLAEDEAELIKQAAPMHDIGKIAILDQILIKPGKLTVDEFEVMKTHSNLGYDLLKSSNRKTLKAAAVIALQHHEKYNGTGYPNGLKGDQIHIYGRIVAVADVFDALGCDRVYKKAWELEKILDYFKQESGKHFDPVLVDILFEKLDLILKVKDTLPD